MNIQNNCNVNFGATRVMVAKKNSGKVKSNIDILKLDYSDKNDVKFVKSIFDTLSDFTKRLTEGQKKLLYFLGEFLNNVEQGHNSDKFFLAIKNNKSVEGGFSEYLLGNEVLLKKAFTTKGNKLVQDTMYEALINETEKLSTKKSKKDLCCIKDNAESLVKGSSRLKAEDLNKKSEEIIQRNPGVTFDKVEDKKVNLINIIRK